MLVVMKFAGIVVGAVMVIGTFCIAKISGRCSRIEEQMPRPEPTPEEVQHSWDLAMADYFGGDDENFR